jgi:hypothetical protein
MRWRTRDSDGAGENRPPNLLFAHGTGRTVLQQAPHFERSTYMHDYLYNDIFGERPESIMQRRRNQEQLAASNKAIDGFFRKSEMDALMRGADSPKPIDLRELQKVIGIESEPVTVARNEQSFTKGSRVSEARSQFLVAVDRFVEQAKESVRSYR